MPPWRNRCREERRPVSRARPSAMTDGNRSAIPCRGQGDESPCACCRYRWRASSESARSVAWPARPIRYRARRAQGSRLGLDMAGRKPRCALRHELPACDCPDIARDPQGQREATFLLFRLASGNGPPVPDRPEDDPDNHPVNELVTCPIGDNQAGPAACRRRAQFRCSHRRRSANGACPEFSEGTVPGCRLWRRAGKEGASGRAGSHGRRPGRAFSTPGTSGPGELTCLQRAASF